MDFNNDENNRKAFDVNQFEFNPVNNKKSEDGTDDIYKNNVNNMNDIFQESVPEKIYSPSAEYYNSNDSSVNYGVAPILSAEEYKKNIKDMKTEMKRVRKEEKLRYQQSYNNGSDVSSANRKRSVGGGALVCIMLACIAIGCALSLVMIMFVPNTDNSVLANFIKKYGKSEVIVQNGNGGSITVNNDSMSTAQAVYAKAAQSVVGIRVVQTPAGYWQKTETIISEGSGVIYSEDGMIITNHHVITDALSNGAIMSGYEVRIYLDTGLKNYFAAKLVGYDSETDLALLKIEAQGLVPMTFADYESIAIGEVAIAIGSPGGLEYMNSISEGIVSGINRDIATSSGTSYELIQTTAAINPGNSGGALLNKEGELIGICVIKIASSEFESMGFAINSSTIKTVIETIKETGSVLRPKMGVSVRTDYTKDVALENGYPEGAYIGAVETDSPAEKVGIKEKDIITEFNGAEVKSYNDLKKEINKCKIGDEVVIKIYRITSGEYMDFTIKLEE